MVQKFIVSKRELTGAAGGVVVQLCHGYDQPFQDVAREYSALFEGEAYRVITIYLTGEADASVALGTGGDEVIFLECISREIRGLKLRAIRELKQICGRYSVKFVIAHRYKAVYIASHVPGVFVLGVHHAFGDYSRRSRVRYVQAKRERIALLGVSNAVRNDLRRSLPELPEQNIATLANRINYPVMKQQLLERREARAQLGLRDDDFVFANVGRLHPDKDQKVLIDAFAEVVEQLPSARLLIIGEGRLRGELEEQIIRLGLQGKALLTGPIPSVARLFTAFDGFVLSSDREPFGMVLLEAMIAGLPMAVSDCGGGPEVVGDTGLMYPSGDHRALARQMRVLHDLNREQRRELAERMDRRLLQRFTREVAARSFWDLPMVRPRLSAEGDNPPQAVQNSWKRGAS